MSNQPSTSTPGSTTGSSSPRRPRTPWTGLGPSSSRPPHGRSRQRRPGLALVLVRVVEPRPLPAIFGRAELLVSSPAFDQVTITSRVADGAPASSRCPRRARRAVRATSTRSGSTASHPRPPGSRSPSRSRAASSTSPCARPRAPGAPARPTSRRRSPTGATPSTTSARRRTARVRRVRSTRPTTRCPAPTWPQPARPRARLPWARPASRTPGPTPHRAPGQLGPHGQNVPMGVAVEKISFLGLATNGPAKGTATVVYTDGTRQDVPVELTDWTPARATSSATSRS
ncbi:hypothetical protein NKG05_09710 [Oerskovia sp. M15]